LNNNQRRSIIMKKQYYSFLLKGGICLLVLLLSQAAQAQNKLFMNPIKYTARSLEVYQSACSDPNNIHLLINGTEVTQSQLTVKYIVGLYYAFEMDFGLMKPGDVFRVTDDCGGIPFEQVVTDDYVYVQVPAAAGTTGNGIGPNDQYAPFTKLSTPVSIGKCTPIEIGSHGHTNYFIFSPQTNGIFKVNGQPLTNGATALNPAGYDINFNGFPGTPVYSINADGSVTTNASVKLQSKTHFSGSIPVVMEYTHGGVEPDGDLALGFPAMQFRQIKNGSCILTKGALGGISDNISLTTSPTSQYKISYDGVYYRAYVDGVLVNEMRRFVEYQAHSGTLTPGSAAGLDYGTKVMWSNMSSGPQWVSVLIDGVLYTRQLFNVAADMAAIPTPTPVACSSGNTGKITVNVTGGLAPFQYALGTGAYSSSNVFSGLAAGAYSVKVRDASGCVATGTATVAASSVLSVSVSSKTDETCATASNASVKLLAAGGTGPYTYSANGVNFQNSNEFTGLASGPYVFSVKDDNGCLGTVNDTIKTSSKLIIGVLSKQDVTCFSGNNGSVSIGTAGSVVSGTLQFSLDNGVTFQASNAFTGLTAGTYQVVVKDNVCAASTNVTINQPAELTISAAVQKGISCNALSDGSIEALGSGGTGVYQYSINGTLYGASNVFSGLAAGNYKLWVKDANGCVKESAIVALTQPGPVALTVFNKTDVSCYGANTGSLTLSGTGGTFPYGYSKDGTTFQTSSTFSDLSAGALTLTLKDANGCKAAISSEILQGADIIVTATNSGTVSCFGGNNGQVTATASGGTGLLKYAIDGVNFVTVSTFTSLTAGSYQVTVSDNNGCKKVSSPVIVAQAAQIIPAITKSEVKCFSGNDGMVTVSASGGTGAYSYSKDAVNFQTTGAFASLVAGDYVFSVKDANSCIRTINASITQPTDLIVSSAAASQVLCYNGNSGIVQASSTGGTSPYQYSVDGTAYQANASFGSLVIGTYKIWVKDANGCVKQTNTVTLTQPSDLLISVASQTAVKCYGGNDGSVQLAASGGVSPYVYSKDSLSYQPSAGFSGLAATAFRFLVKDANGCSKGVTAQVAQPAQPYKISLASQTSLTCNSENIGRIEVKNAGGTAPYQVSLDNTTFQPTEVFSGLGAGTYTVYGKDANSCTFTMPVVTLTQPTSIVVTLLSKKDVDCEYYTKGEALVGAQGSNGNFSYTLAGSDFKFNTISPVTNTSGLFENLMAGDYTVTARDQSGCMMDFPVTIIPKSTNIRYDISKTLPSSCTSEDGSISVINASGGRPPYQYSISSQNSFSANSTFSGVLNGTYLVTVADELCSYKKEVDLRLPNSIKADYSIDPVSCATPVANLTVTNITGGNGNYQLSLNGGGFSANRSFANLHPNVYNLVVQDSPLSCKTAIGIEIKEQNRADMQIVSRQNVLCYGGNSGSITIKGDNNMGPFTYAINNGTFTADGTFSGLTIGTYRLYVKNRMGCLDSLRTTLVEPTKLTSNFTKKDNDCYGDKTGGLELFGNGGTPAYVFSIDGSSYVSSGKFETLAANTYKAYVKDANGCISTQDIPVVQPSLLTIVPMYQDTVRCFGESNGMVNVIAGGGTPAYQYSINGTDYLPDSKFSNLGAGTYQFYAKDAKGCLKTANISITQPQLLELSFVSKQDPLCYEGKDGIIKVLAKGGNGGNVYTLDNNTGQSADQFTGLTQSIYNIKVADRKGCSASMPSVELKWPAKIESSFSTVMPVCFSDANGTIHVDVKGGTPGYKAIFAGQTLSLVDNRFTFDKLTAGTYPVDIQDQNGCVDKLNILLEQPTALTGIFTATNNKCFGDQTGRIEVNGSGATPAYQYAISGKGYTTSGIFTNLTADNYQISIKDAQGCILNKVVTLAQPTQVSLLAMNLDTVRCYGEKNGSIRILAKGGTPGYTYSQDALQYYSDSTFINLAAGSYRFRVKDANSCEQSTTLTITEPELLNLSLVQKTDPLCAGDQNGRINLKAAGGNGGYVFWKDNASQQKTNVFEGLTQSEYAFKVVDRKGCEDTVSSVRLVWPKPMQSQLSWQSPLCAGENSASVALALSGGTSPYSVSAPSISAKPVIDGNVFTYNGLASGRYMLSAKDANGCISFALADVAASEKINPLSFPSSDPVCKGQEIILEAGNPGMQVQWFYKNEEIPGSRNGQKLTAVEPGTYKVVITTKTGCTTSKEYTLLNSNNALKADFLMTVEAFVGDTITALDISRPTPDQITWELPAEAQTVTKQMDKVAFAIIEDGGYDIKMTARKGDCINTVTRQIKIFNKEDIDDTNPDLHYEDLNLIQDMVVYPNPNFGKFTVTVKLTKVTDVVMTMSSSSSNTVILRKEETGKKEYVFEVDQKNFMQEVYLITIQAGKSVLYKRALLMN
jgi:hypothetical protein